MKIRAAVLNRMGAPMPYAESKPLSITEVDLDPPGPGEVLVKIAAAGLCHSDRYQRTAHRITSAVNCRPLNALPCRMTPAPLSALSRRSVYPIRTHRTNLQQIRQDRLCAGRRDPDLTRWAELVWDELAQLFEHPQGMEVRFIETVELFSVCIDSGVFTIHEAEEVSRHGCYPVCLPM